MEFSDLLSGAGDVLSAPRRLLWKGLSAPFGANIQSGEDLTNAMGLDSSHPLVKALGIGSEIVGDPLTWMLPAGAGMLGKAFGRGAKVAEVAGAAASRPSAFLSEAAAAQARGAEQLTSDVMRRLAPSGVSQPSSYANEMLAKYAPEASKIGRYRNVEILDPGQTAQMEQLVTSGGRMPSGMHGGIFRSKTAGPVGFTGEVANRPESGVTLARAMRNALSPEELAARQARGLHGFYDRATNTMVEMAGAAPETIPHELLHALTWNAAKSGNWKNLPLLQRAAARLYQPYAADVARLGVGNAQRGFRSGLATMADELGSFSLENPTLGRQIAGGAKFLFKGDPGYAASFDKHSRLVGDLYRGLHYAPHVAAGTAAAGAGGALLDRLGMFPNNQP